MSQSASERFVPQQLPLFEGRRPDYAMHSFSGSVTASPYDPPSRVGSSQFFLVEAVTTGVAHIEKPTKEEIEFIRKQTQSVVAHFVIDGDRAAELMAEFDPQTRLAVVNPKADRETGEIKD